jgi:hypothetical protein
MSDERREVRGALRDRSIRGNANLLTGEFEPPAKMAEKLAIRMGRCCLFSIICTRS